MNSDIAKLTPFDASKRALEGTANFRENANYSWGWLAQHASEVNKLIDDLNIYKNGLRDILSEYVLENLEENVVNNAISKKINISDIQDVLDSTATDKPLSANQGRVLKGFVDHINQILTSDDTSLDELQEIVNFIKQNKSTLDTQYVKLTGNQTINDIKTFSSSPIVPTPTAGNQAATKKYVDDNSFNPTPTINGTVSFNSTTNNINLTNIVTALGLEIGDVIQISGATDSKNNSEFTVEVITNNSNIIVNQAHANQNTTKNVANRSGDTDVTVKLLAKYYNAPLGLGQGWVNMTASRSTGVTYPNNTKRSIQLLISGATYTSFTFSINVLTVASGSNGGGETTQIFAIIPNGSTCAFASSVITYWSELR